jgi:hypothetical protein
MKCSISTGYGLRRSFIQRDVPVICMAFVLGSEITSSDQTQEKFIQVNVFLYFKVLRSFNV